ncbi:MAG: APC family permease [Chthoniobacterales bacterium]|nr:APC family permease [Chthoniobacterales bacterium]
MARETLGSVPSGALLRVLGLGFGIAVLVGNTIGSGILRNPGEVAGRLPNVSLFLGVWIAGGVYALLGSNALAEVASITRESGGYGVFVRRGLGPYLGFVAGWSDWLSTCSSVAAAAIMIGESVNVLARGRGAMIPFVGAAVLTVFTLLQWRGIKSASNTQNVTTLLKAAAFLVFVGVCFAFGDAASAPRQPPTVPQGIPLFVALILAMQAVIFTYDGWIGPAYFAGELRDPGRELPRAIFSGVAAVIVIYLLVNVALLSVLPIAQLAGDPFAAGSAAAAIFGPRGDTVLRALVILTLLSAINAYLLMTSRTLWMLSGWTRFARGRRVNAGGTPTTALLLSAIVSVLFVFSGAYERVIAITAFLFVANYTFTYLSLFMLRRREPEALRPYRAWGHPWTTGFVLLISVALLLGALMADTRNSIASIGLLLLSYPIFRILSRRRQSAA